MFLRWFRPLKNPVTACICHPSISAFWICFSFEKDLFLLCRILLLRASFRWGKQVLYFSCEIFFFRSIAFSLRFFGLILQPVFPDFSFRYRMTIWMFKLGSVYFVFIGFILLGLGWGGWLAGRTHSFSFKFSWDRTSSWDSHPYHTWRWKDCLCISFWQEPVPDCLQLTSYLGGCSLWIFVYNRFPWAINLWSLFHVFAYDFRPVLLELFGSTIGPYLLDVFRIKNWSRIFGSSGRRFLPVLLGSVPVLYLVYIIALGLENVNSFLKENTDFLEK